ncbi:MAG: AZOBR_p60025 family cell surface glycopolymer formation protein [Acidimicrobiales bacterium]
MLAHRRAGRPSTRPRPAAERRSAEVAEVAEAPRVPERRHVPSSPAVPGAIALLGALALGGVRMAGPAAGRASSFVVAGSLYANPARVPRGLRVLPGSGYDGQFNYRLALDPFDLARQAFGIRFDTVFRLQRIGYPFLAWAGSLGRASLVPYSLIALNVLALAALGALGGVLASGSGRHAAWGLLFPAYFGFAFSLSRDLSEPVAAAFLLAGIIALRRERPVIAALALTVSILTRETTALLIAALFFTKAASWLGNRHRASPGSLSPGSPPLLSAADAAWAVPALAFGAWQLVVASAWSKLPGAADTSANLGVPFAALFAAAALASITKSSARPHEVLAFVFAIVMTVSLSAEVWMGQADFHSLYDVYVLAVIVLLGSKRRLGPLGVVAGTAWSVVALHMALFI